MARRTEDHELTDEEMIDRLRDTAEDERAGRLVSCENEDDLRTFFAGLRTSAM
jgi:hypothetical protein